MRLPPPLRSGVRSANTATQGAAIGVFNEKRRCADGSLYDIKISREGFKRIRSRLRSRGTLMPYANRSAQRRFKTNTPETSFDAAVTSYDFQLMGNVVHGRF